MSKAMAFKKRMACRGKGYAFTGAYYEGWTAGVLTKEGKEIFVLVPSCEELPKALNKFRAGIDWDASRYQKVIIFGADKLQRRAAKRRAGR